MLACRFPKKKRTQHQYIFYFQLSKGLQVFPDHYDCLVYRGKMYLRQHQPHLALIDFDKAIKFNEKKGFAYIGKGTALKELGKADEAIKTFTNGL